jgi:ABC-type multidrug transport system permease subunit
MFFIINVLALIVFTIYLFAVAFCGVTMDHTSCVCVLICMVVVLIEVAVDSYVNR